MFTIYRRLFNPKEGQKQLKLFVAKFAAIAEPEANKTLAVLQDVSTSMKDHPFFSEWRYTLEKDALAPRHGSEEEGIQVDTSKAKPTKRPIAFEYSWSALGDNQCECLAHHKLYGAIRGTVDNSPAGRKLFMARITSVWPNATLVAK